MDELGFGKEDRHAKGAFLIGLRSLVLIAALGCVGRAAEVTLAWDPNSEGDLAGYKFYYGGQTRNYTNVVDVGNATTNAVSGLSQGGTYFFAVTAYNTSGLESDFSNEVRYDVPSSGAPVLQFKSVNAQTNKNITFVLAAPAGQTVVIEGSADFVHWMALSTNVVTNADQTLTVSAGPSTNDLQFYRAKTP